MLSFKQYLFEVLRDPERAQKLVDNLAKKRKKAEPLGKFYINPEEEKPQMHTLLKTVDEYPKVSSRAQYSDEVNIDKIYTSQKTVSPHVVKKKIKKGSESPFLYHANGKYFVSDGNHGLNALRATGIKTVKATIYDKEDKK
jgi:hypothetical protein